MEVLGGESFKNSNTRKQRFWFLFYVAVNFDKRSSNLVFSEWE